LTAVQWGDPAAPVEEAFRIVPVTGRLALYDDHGVRRTRAALVYAWGLFRNLARNRREYDVVIVSGLPLFNVFAARAALFGSGARVVVDYLEVWGRRQWVEYAGAVTGSLAWFIQRMAIAITPLATCHSQLTANALRANGLHSPLLVSPGLIEGETGAASASPASSPPYVLYAGRHIPDKRVDTLPAAVARAREQIGDLRLVILGAGPSTDAVKAAVDSVSGREWTDFLGFVSEKRLTELMAGASVLVNPSRREGYGLVVVEASAHGTPVVLVDDPGNAATELVQYRVNGFVARSTSPDELGSAIVESIRDGTALRESSRRWYEDAVRTRTVERTVDAILSAVDPAVSQSTVAADPDDRLDEGPE
jgi:glycosyltransferase involved in cell wall biosynthesis